MTKSTPLTEQQIALAAKLRAQGMGWRKISRTIRGSEERLMRIFEPEKSITCARTRGLGLDMPNANKPRPEVPDYVLAERDRRLSLPRDPMRELMGDPPPGCSALDRRRAA